MLIGEYNKAVILTYLGVLFGIIGLFFSFDGNILYAMICLLIAGICDMFDGKVARSCKRDKDAKMFGIEIDSLADTVNFVVLPVVIFYNMGLNSWYYVIIYTIYVLGGIIRLAYFNVLASKEKFFKPIKYYTGLPVTTSSFIFPFVYMFSYILDKVVFQGLLTGIILLVGFLFVYKFKIKKPSSKTLYFFLVIAIILALTLLLIAR